MTRELDEYFRSLLLFLFSSFVGLGVMVDRDGARARAAVDEDAFDAAVLFPIQSHISYAAARKHPRMDMIGSDRVEDKDMNRDRV